MRGLIGFLPWIVYGFIATGDEWRWGGLVGLGTALALIAWDRAQGRGWDETLVETTAAAFFALVVLYSLLWPDSELPRYGPALLNAALALMAWGSLALRTPFTLGIARTMAPEEVHGTEAFRALNTVVTGFWAVCFTAAAIALAVVLYLDPYATAVVIAIKVATFAVPIAFTVRYPKAVRRRMHA